jgi:signal transduction histidine kinase
MTSTSAAQSPAWFIARSATWRQIGRDLAYILPGFPLSLVSFTVLIPFFFLGMGTVIIWIGLAVLALTFVMARAFASANRTALRRWSGQIPPTYYKTTSNRSIRGMLQRLTDPQLWRDLAHGTLVSLPFRTFSFGMTVSWLAVIAAGFTKWFWQVYLPEDDANLAVLIGLDTRFSLSPETAQVILELTLGTVFLLSLPFVLHFFAATDAAMARGLLTNENASLRARGEELARARAQVVAEEAHLLRKVERDLHDGPQQRLIRLQMDVEAAKRRMGQDPDAARGLMDEAIEQSRQALMELRSLSRGIAPPILSDRGLNAAIRSIAARSTVPVAVTSNLADDARLDDSAENAAYFVAAEALANVAKHSNATSAAVRITRTAAALTIDIDDDGTGGAHSSKGHGLAGLADRLAGVDGVLEMHSPEGGPTSLRAEIPLQDQLVPAAAQ